MITLRPYQQEAVDRAYEHLREHDDNPCIVIPTAGGKTPILATICKDAVGFWKGRVLIVAHVKELLDQAVDKLRTVAPELADQVGVNSAGLKSRATSHAILVAGVQSVYRRAAELGRFDLVLIDEAHMIPPDGDGMYRTLISALKAVNPQVRVIGLTATPFRMSSGTICAPENILNAVCYEVGVRELIVQGFLCRLKSKASRAKVDTRGLHVRGGEFIANEVEDLMDDESLVEAAAKEIISQAHARKAVLVFTSGVRHGEHVARKLRELGQSVAAVFGETRDCERDRTLAEFKASRIKYLVNVNVLTTGFDAPHIDCVAMLRPTLSPGLYYQMVGRGFRLHPGKADCLVLDFGGNVLRHGPVDAIRIRAGAKIADSAPARECPRCQSVIAASYEVCPECSFEFPGAEEGRRAKHAPTASEAGVLSGETTFETHTVLEVRYSVHRKRGAADDAPRSMRVEYRVGYHQYQSEWVCLEHSGFARKKAEQWWQRRSNARVPDTAEDAVTYAEAGALCTTTSITVRNVAGEEWSRITGYELGEKPFHREPGEDDVEDQPRPFVRTTVDDEVPF